MLEMCISGFFVTSVAVSILLWRALAAAKRADKRLQRIGGGYIGESSEESTYLVKLIPSPND